MKWDVLILCWVKYCSSLSFRGVITTGDCFCFLTICVSGSLYFHLLYSPSAQFSPSCSVTVDFDCLDYFQSTPGPGSTPRVVFGGKYLCCGNFACWFRSMDYNFTFFFLFLSFFAFLFFFWEQLYWHIIHRPYNSSI